MARFAGDGRKIDFDTGFDRFKNKNAETNTKEKMIDVNTSFDNGKVNVTVQPNLQEIVNPKPVKIAEDINIAKQIYIPNKPTPEEKKIGASKPIVDDVLFKTHSNVGNTFHEAEIPFKKYEDYIDEFKQSNGQFKYTWENWDKINDFKEQSINNRFREDSTKLFKEELKDTVRQEYLEKGIPLTEFEKNKEKILREYAVDARFKNEKYEFKDKYSEHIDYGGGADLNTSYKVRYDASGKLQDIRIKNSKIFLSKKNRTDTKGVRNKTALFIDKAVDIEELFRNEEGDINDKTDAKIAALFDANARGHLRTAGRYKDIEHSLKKEIKKLEKYDANIDSKFINEDRFDGDTNKQFTTIIDNMFEKTLEKDEKFINEAAVKDKQEVILSTVPISIKEQNKLINSDSNNPIKLSSVVSIEDKFENGASTNKDQLKIRKSQKKATKKANREEVRKAATMTAVANFIRNKKNLRNDITGESSGDIMHDGQGAILMTIISLIKTAVSNLARKIATKIASMIVHSLISLIGFLCTTIIPMLINFIPVIAIAVLIMFLGQNSDSGESSFDVNNVTGNGQYYSTLDESDINSIVNSIKRENPSLTNEKLKAIEYALSKVGSEYNQAYHGNSNVDIFDCSSLVYRAYKEAGIDISNNGYYTAAEECRALMEAGKTSTDGLKAGDLIFYGGSDNGRYMGIYHVAIYVGKVNGVDKMVEARSTEAGVVYCDVRTNNVVNISHPV